MIIDIRYLTIENHITREQVENFSRESQVTRMQALDILRDRTKPVLQYLIQVDDSGKREWRNVNFVTEYRNERE